MRGHPFSIRSDLADFHRSGPGVIDNKFLNRQAYCVSEKLTLCSIEAISLARGSGVGSGSIAYSGEPPSLTPGRERQSKR
jgi:hypothetical protein